MARAKRKRIIINLLIAVIIVAVFVLALPDPTHDSVTTQKTNNQTAAKSNSPSSFNKHLYSTDEASSLWVVVNKGRVLPSDYVPQRLVVPSVPLRLSTASPEMRLRSDSASALMAMFAAAEKDGVNLKLESGYRSYDEQRKVYAAYVASSGVQQADTFSARPGHSEHQTGLAADIEPLSRECEVEQCFETTAEGKWLEANSYKYGFIIRYPKDAENLTGYEYEPWHVRYVGTALAREIYVGGQTLEQFFGLPIYTTYPSDNYEIKDI